VTGAGIIRCGETAVCGKFIYEACCREKSCGFCFLSIKKDSGFQLTYYSKLVRPSTRRESKQGAFKALGPMNRGLFHLLFRWMCFAASRGTSDKTVGAARKWPRATTYWQGVYKKRTLPAPTAGLATPRRMASCTTGKRSRRQDR
jgi:hypothetical protein